MTTLCHIQSGIQLLYYLAFLFHFCVKMSSLFAVRIKKRVKKGSIAVFNTENIAFTNVVGNLMLFAWRELSYITVFSVYTTVVAIASMPVGCFRLCVSCVWFSSHTLSAPLQSVTLISGCNSHVSYFHRVCVCLCAGLEMNFFTL